MIKLIAKFCITGIVTLLIFLCVSLAPSSMDSYTYWGGFVVAWLTLFVFSLFIG